MNKDNTKISANRQKKELLIAEMTEKVSRSKAFVFTNYQGLTHQQIEGLKRASKKLDAEYVVIKNTLMLRALEGFKLSDEDKKHFEQPTATLFIYGDVIEPLKALAKVVKQFQLPAVKMGIFENHPISSEQVVKLSNLPPLPVLRGQLLGMMISPIQGLHRALSWNMQSLVMTLNAIAQKKG